MKITVWVFKAFSWDSYEFDAHIFLSEEQFEGAVLSNVDSAFDELEFRGIDRPEDSELSAMGWRKALSKWEEASEDIPSVSFDWYVEEFTLDDQGQELSSRTLDDMHPIRGTEVK